MASSPSPPSLQLDGRAKPARREVTVKAIAEAVGLSQPAVSQVLNGTGRIAPATRERVLQVADAMGYRPNAAARAIVTQKTRQVGVLVRNNANDPFTSPNSYFTILGINMALEAAGYVLCLVRIDDVEHSVEGHSRVFRENVLDGVIVNSNLPNWVFTRIQQLVPACVWADTSLWQETSCIRRDETAVGQAVASAVAAAGYKKVIYLTEEIYGRDVPPHYSHLDREQGIADVCRQERLTLQVARHKWDWSRALSDRLFRQLGPDVAVIADDLARSRMMLQTAALHRLAIGCDFGLACCDNVPIESMVWPGLSGMTFDRVQFGRLAAEMMLSLLKTGHAPKSVLTGSTWHDGNTLRDRAAVAPSRG